MHRKIPRFPEEYEILNFFMKLTGTEKTKQVSEIIRKLKEGRALSYKEKQETMSLIIKKIVSNFKTSPNDQSLIISFLDDLFKRYRKIVESIEVQLSSQKTIILNLINYIIFPLFTVKLANWIIQSSLDMEILIEDNSFIFLPLIQNGSIIYPIERLFKNQIESNRFTTEQFSEKILETGTAEYYQYIQGNRDLSIPKIELISRNMVKEHLFTDQDVAFNLTLSCRIADEFWRWYFKLFKRESSQLHELSEILTTQINLCLTALIKAKTPVPGSDIMTIQQFDFLKCLVESVKDENENFIGAVLLFIDLIIFNDRFIDQFQESFKTDFNPHSSLIEMINTLSKNNKIRLLQIYQSINDPFNSIIASDIILSFYCDIHRKKSLQDESIILFYLTKMRENLYNQYYQYKVDLFEARYHIQCGRVDDAIRCFQSALDNSLYRGGKYTETIIIEGCLATSLETGYYKNHWSGISQFEKFYRAGVELGIFPENLDEIDEYLIRDYRSRFPYYFRTEFFFQSADPGFIKKMENLTVNLLSEKDRIEELDKKYCKDIEKKTNLDRMHKGFGTKPMTYLMIYSGLGDLDKVKELMISGANINLTADDRSTVIILALQNGHDEIAGYLISHPSVTIETLEKETLKYKHSVFSLLLTGLNENLIRKLFIER